MRRAPAREIVRGLFVCVLCCDVVLLYLLLDSLLLHSLESHRNGFVPRRMRGQEVGSENIAPETSRVEHGSDFVRDLGVRLSRQAPVQAGALMVHGVIAVVEQQRIQESDEVARMIELGLFVGMN